MIDNTEIIHRLQRIESKTEELILDIIDEINKEETEIKEEDL